MKASILKVLLSFGSLMVSAHSFSVEQSPASFDELSKSIQLKLNSSNYLERYHSHKANMWLAYAKNEQSENSLTDAGREAFENSQMIANALIKEQVATLPLTTPILSVSQVMRRDLWQQIEYFKQHGALHSAPQALAEAEVMLVWAAAEYCELGWIHAKEHFYAVARRLYQVKQTLPELEIISFDTTKLPTLDELNGTGCQGVNSAYWPIQKQQKSFGLDVIDQKSELVFKNIKLSSEVMNGLQDLGVSPDVNIMYAKSRRVVIDFQNIDGIQLSVQPQWRDLQLEMK